MNHNSIRPARRVENIEEYYLGRKLKEVARLRHEGHDIISLGIGGPDRCPAAEVIDTLREAATEPDANGYQVQSGLPALRDAMARWYSRHYGVTLDPTDEIQPMMGSKEGVIQIDLTFLNPGDGVLIPDPGYPTYASAARLAEATIHTYNLRPENGWQPDFDELEKMDTSGIKLMWVNYPHMPTGAPARKDVMERLVDFCRRRAIVLAHDNPYSFILNDNPQSIMSIEGAKEIAIELNSLSKSHNMAGWRMAMAVSNPTFIDWLRRVKSNIDSGMFRPIMKAAVKALELGDEWYSGLNDIYRRRRIVAERIMTALGCRFDPAQRGLFLWGRIPDSEPSSEAMCDRLLREAEVFVTPGMIFGSNGNRYIRISLCADEERMEQALKRIENLKNNTDRI